MKKETLRISDLAIFLNRRTDTIRGWERDGVLPKKLMPTRDENKWRSWTQEQAEQIKLWIQTEDRRPGKGLEHYNPTPEQAEAHIEKTRGQKE